MAALEDGVDALSFASGAAAIIALLMSLATAGDNVIVSCFTHGGTYHQFEVVAAQLGIQARFCDTNDLERARQLIDDKTRFIFTESIGNPKFSIPDMEPLAKIAHCYKMAFVVDATFTAGGYFCQPAKWGADLVLHSASKWVGGHGTTLGGVVIDTGRSDWQSNAARYPQFHGMRPGREGLDPNLYEKIGDRAFMMFFRKDILRDTGACLSAYAAQQLFIGVETLSLRCERADKNTALLAQWLRAHPRIKGVQWLGYEDHPYHKMACKYLQRGFGTVLSYQMDPAEGLQLVDNFRLIVNTTNVGDCKTVVGHHWSTTHKQNTKEENEVMGVYDNLFRLSLGTEDIKDIIGDFEQAFERTPHGLGIKQ